VTSIEEAFHALDDVLAKFDAAGAMIEGMAARIRELEAACAEHHADAERWAKECNDRDNRDDGYLERIRELSARVQELESAFRQIATQAVGVDYPRMRARQLLGPGKVSHD
jgi:DNA repair ATPase RecN